MWSEIKDDIVEFVQEFHKNGKLGSVIADIIGEHQLAFIEGRHLCEGVATANEIIDDAKRKKKKSFVFKVDFKKAFDKEMAWILNCKTGVLPFKYLGVPVGGNHRKLSIITLLNSVLTSLPILFLSVYLAPKGIVKTLDKIRNKFLWGGCEETRKVHWVNWKTVCISKRDGGLWVKDLRLFNQALLGKWWGRLAKGSPGLLFNLIKEKYGYEGGNWCNWVKEGKSARSNWWKDLCKLDVLEENRRGWLSGGFQIRIGNGEKVSFWKDSWSNTRVLANVFPRLYMLSTGKDNTIDEMGRWEDNKWVWNLPWRCTPHSWEQDSMQDLNKLLKETNLTIGKEDTWTWERDKLGDYSTSSGYTALVQHQPSPY
ncbi:hypothetical protein SLEP1_g55264 [Rubroshorea leprosula]|uniref:Uncharacterized protein n=1 Tax=Rubroshorea leprosula TaxID=152421 RepID=A0AAV5MF06_9ROSI|nr:hypothetical protein SLEP1_g55264 [Rubroshorea leprosula]